MTATGASVRPWDKPDNATLYARWAVKSYEIQINDNGTVIWLGPSGLSDVSCSIEYGTVLSAINLISTFKNSSHGYKEGKVFDRFEYDDNTLNWTSIPDLGDNGAIITITPVWILETHTIYLHTLSPIITESIVQVYGGNINLPNVGVVGYTSLGWYTDPTGGIEATWATMPDLTPNTQNNGSTVIYARWTANTYTVYYYPNGGVGNVGISAHTYGVSKSLNANAFSRVGHDFVGWATSADATAVYSDCQGVTNLTAYDNGVIRLYAVWSPQTYSIVYKNLMPDMVVIGNKYTYGVGVPVMPMLNVTVDFTYQPHERFYGWYTNGSFTTRVYSIPSNSTGTVTVYAKYDYLILRTTANYEQTVTDIGQQPSFDIGLYLGSYLYDKIKHTTLDNIKITINMDIREVNDGYQDLFLYNGDKQIWTRTVDHGGDGINKQYASYSFEINLALANYANTDILELRFGAHGMFADTWKFDNFDMTICLTN